MAWIYFSTLFESTARDDSVLYSVLAYTYIPIGYVLEAFHHLVHMGYGRGTDSMHLGVA